MPGGDGTGPWWTKGRWRCRRPGYGMGFGPGYGRGFGRGMGRAAYAVQEPQAQETELLDLEAHAGNLESELNEVKRKIKELKR